MLPTLPQERKRGEKKAKVEARRKTEKETILVISPIWISWSLLGEIADQIVKDHKISQPCSLPTDLKIDWFNDV